jgi:hypothetical protein
MSSLFRLRAEYQSFSTSCTTACTPVGTPIMLCRTSCGLRLAPGSRRATACRKSTTPRRRPACAQGPHAEYVNPAEFAHFLDLVPGEVEFDCMLEAKAKDLALFRVRDALGIAP